MKAPHEDVEVIGSVAACLHSVVGASKVLHFFSPRVFPIWDAKVARVWGDSEPTAKALADPREYVQYACQVHALIARDAFRSFKGTFCEAYSARLENLQIRRYRLTDVRTVEAAAFELSDGEYQDM